MKAALLFLSIFVMVSLPLSRTAISQDDPPKGQRGIDLMWSCQKRGMIYDFAAANDLSDADFFGEFDLLMCASYISGIVDMNALNAGISGASLFCIPKTGIPQEQQILVFLKWTEKYPERLHESRRSALVSAMVESFPCPAK